MEDHVESTFLDDLMEVSTFGHTTLVIDDEGAMIAVIPDGDGNAYITASIDLDEFDDIEHCVRFMLNSLYEWRENTNGHNT